MNSSSDSRETADNPIRPPSAPFAVVSPRSNAAGESSLRPALGTFTALTIVVGGVIGSGIFFKPGVVVAHCGGDRTLALWLWVVCGLVNLCGALSQAELAAMFPHAGGSYVFLREAYGRAWAFAWAWAEFWVVRTGAIAALAVALTMSIKEILASAGWSFDHAEWRWIEKLSAIGVIALLAAVNIAGVVWGGRTQNVTTILKVLFIVALVVLPFLPAAANHAPLNGQEIAADAAPTPNGDLWLGIGAALAAVMWTYDGWGNLTVVAEEVRSPERAVPLALAGGMVIVIALYVAVNVGLFHAASDRELAEAAIPAAVVFDRAFGPDGRNLLYAMLIVSVFGALNQNILTGPRVLLAAGRDYGSLAALRRIDPRTGTPAVAIAGLSAWAAVLVLFGDAGIGSEMIAGNRRLFDVLTDYCIFGGSIFYLLAVLAVFVLRIRRPEAARPFRTPIYPFVPAVFVMFYVGLLVSMAVANPRESAAGLAFVSVGVAVAVALGRTSLRGRS
jgi:APA family basic amino acid/polyamine antiporter